MPTIRKEKAKIKAVLPRDARPFDVVALGENSMDLVAVVPDWPAPDAKVRLDRFEMLPGGQMATAAIACARLGLRSRYCGSVGDDAWGDAARSALTRSGVDARLITRPGVRSRCAVALVHASSGRRTILEYRDPALRIEPAEIDSDWISSARVLMLDTVDPEAGRVAAQLAHRAGMAIVLDADASGQPVEPLLRAADVIIASESFPEAQTGAASLDAAIDEIARRYEPALIVVTLGREGAVARWRGRPIRVPARSVDVVDTTGAGDAFRAGFVASWLALGDEAPVEELLRRATVVAALNCRGIGAQGALPSAAELEAWL